MNSVKFMNANKLFVTNNVKEISFTVFVSMLLISVFHFNILDYKISRYMNYVGENRDIIDTIVGIITGLNAFSNILMMSIVVFAWFYSDTGAKKNSVFIGALTSFGAGVISRILQFNLPMHVRPLYDPALNFRLPSGVGSGTLSHWSSFPSDHATIFFGFACTINAVNPVAGVLAYILAFIFDFGRIYLGYHFLSDVIGGAALGIFCVTLTRPLCVNKKVNSFFLWCMSHKPYFFAVSFYFSICIATMFDDYRAAILKILHMFHVHIPS
ncbi:phosphatase PAP2 family protein [Gluconacetobacter asukensis]|uniref:Phosphatase PAP2 family protein n=1 Tax=Gluconacetobacter asukensis TaxID=1017181 RepID=A0A7W4NZ83_9PROT|nr:phosphatase PAP2 family protein [Gluconacetobacter asukensis]